jgi:hypothetical protein
MMEQRNREGDTVRRRYGNGENGVKFVFVEHEFKRPRSLMEYRSLVEQQT